MDWDVGEILTFGVEDGDILHYFNTILRGILRKKRRHNLRAVRKDLTFIIRSVPTGIGLPY